MGWPSQACHGRVKPPRYLTCSCCSPLCIFSFKAAQKDWRSALSSPFRPSPQLLLLPQEKKKKEFEKKKKRERCRQPAYSYIKSIPRDFPLKGSIEKGSAVKIMFLRLCALCKHGWWTSPEQLLDGVQSPAGRSTLLQSHILPTHTI